MAETIVNQASKQGHILAGRMATYSYLDMDQTVRQTMDKIKEAGL
jgi:UDP-galactopyranose mutase